MRKIFTSILFIASIVSAAIVSCLLFFIIIPIAWRNTYSIQQDGTIMCGFPIFTSDNWMWVSFELFGIPILILCAAIATAWKYRPLRRS